MSDLVGRTLKQRYRVDAFLGRGGMAEVYRAWDAVRQHYVAIKVMREDMAEDLEFVERFQQEAADLRELAHDNIVRFYGFEREGLIAFIVMEYVEGDTLRSLIARAPGPLPPDQVLSVTRQVCAALGYAHMLGLIHRDVKPGNIMIRRDGRVLLTDFGIAKAVDAATITAVQPGAPAYMSPEQCLGKHLDPRTDVYSLGIVIYEMLAHRRPFTGDSAPETIISRTDRIRWEQMRAVPPSLRHFNPDVPPQVDSVVLKALAKDREDRWPSATTFWEALADAYGFERGASQITPSTITSVEAMSSSSASVPVMPITRPHRLPRSKAGIWAAVSVFLVGLLAAVAWLGLSRGLIQPATTVAQLQTRMPAILFPPPVVTVTPTATKTSAMQQSVLQPESASEVSTTPSPTATGTPTKTMTNTATPTGTPVPSYTFTVQPSSTSTPSATPTPTATSTSSSTPTETATVTPTATAFLVVKEDDTNIRAGPGTMYGVVARSAKGASYAAVARDASGAWLRLGGDEERWISAAMVDVFGKVTVTNKIPPPPPVMPKAPELIAPFDGYTAYPYNRATFQ